MAEPFEQLASWVFDKGYISNIAKGTLGDFLAMGSENCLVDGEGYIRCSRGAKLLNGLVGARLWFLCDQFYAGLGTVGVNGLGSVFRVRDLLTYIGTGQVTFNGVSLAGIIASSILSFVKKTGATYVAGPTTGPFQAGEAQPSAPIVTPKDSPSAGKNPMSGAIVLYIWRVSQITGQISLASLPSNIVVLNGQTAICQLPLADSNGQTHWGIGGPKIGFAELGVGYQIPISLGGEVAEADITYTRALGASSAIVRGLTAASNATPIVITDNGHPFSTGDPVVIAGVTGNTNANGNWTVTKIDANTYSLNGSVGNAAYAGGGTVGTNIVTAAGGAFVAADIGRRVGIAAFDSWINKIDSPTQVRTNDLNSTGATITAAGTVTHAIDGILRAVEISYSNGALLAQLVPDKAFPPVPGQFAGVMNDTMWLDANGIIYIGDPGFLGSFPPSNAAFANEEAICYLQVSDNAIARFGQNSMGALTYVGGSPSIEYQTVLQNQGIKLPQNVALGFGGRLMAWFGKPTIVGDNLEPDFQYAKDVLPDFKGWNENQSTAQPIVAGYDGVGQYECWCYQKKIMARHGPTGQWCAPQNYNTLPGNILAAVTQNHVLYLSCNDGAGNLVTYQFDAGAGAVMKVVTSEQSRLNFSCDITQIMTEGRSDNILNPVKINVIRNFNERVLDYVLDADAKPVVIGTQMFKVREPNILECEQHGLEIIMTGVGGATDIFGNPVDAGINKIVTAGATSEVLVR